MSNKNLFESFINKNKNNSFASFSDKNYINYQNSIQKFNGKIIANDCCNICLEQLNNTNVCITICEHKFHTSCIVQCHEKICPVCRKSLLL